MPTKKNIRTIGHGHRPLRSAQNGTVYKYLLIESHWQCVSVWSVIVTDDLRTSVTRLG